MSVSRKTWRCVICRKVEPAGTPIAFERGHGVIGKNYIGSARTGEKWMPKHPECEWGKKVAQ